MMWMPEPPPSRRRKRRGQGGKRTTSSYSSLSCYYFNWATLWFVVLILVMVMANLSFVLFYYHGSRNEQEGEQQQDPYGSSSSVRRRSGTPQSFTSLSEQTEQSSQQQQQQQENGRERVVRLLQEEAGVTTLTPELITQLPTWQQVSDLYGDKPRILFGNDNSKNICSTFQNNVPPLHRMVGAAGLFSTGTNFLTVLLKKNCQIPERVQFYGAEASKEQHGMRWQVPWGKHTPAHYRQEQFSAPMAKGVQASDLLPVVTIRHPLYWMKSMCKNPYTAQWSHTRSNCPNLRVQQQQEIQQWNNVSVKYGAGTQHYASLAHLYNDWYRGYYAKDQDARNSAPFPWIMVRMEDLIFHTYDTVLQVCECAGGRLIPNNNNNSEATTRQQLQYPLDSAKADSPGHDTTTNLVTAWIKYSRPPELSTWQQSDIEAAQDILDPELLDVFGYKFPSPT